MPRISRYPSALTPVAIRQCTFTVRPPSRTFWVSASIHTNVYGPASSGRFRKPSTSSSSSAAIADDLRLGQAHHAEGGGELLHPPGRDAQQVDWSPRPRPAPARPGGGAPGTTGSTTRAAASGSPARSSPPGYPTPAAGTRCGSSPGPASPPRTPRCSGPRRRRPSSAGRTPGSSPAARPGSPMPGSPRTARREPAQCHLRPLRSPSSRLPISKDREVAASLHGDTPYSGKTVTSVPATPYTTSVDVNGHHGPDVDQAPYCLAVGAAKRPTGLRPPEP